DEVASRQPGTEARPHYVDAPALDLVRRPGTFDVMVMEPMFGDIISDQTSGLVGGMGMAPSGDIGDRHALFQPCQGSAPDIAGQGRANPTATILSAAMMLDWLAERHGDARLARAAASLDEAVDRVFGDGRVRPFEFGGTDGTRRIAAEVAGLL
ncbi:MAG: isocitrate/isopropylmalate family dehydrogenase, partial [Burkholderiales bacterium]